MREQARARSASGAAGASGGRMLPGPGRAALTATLGVLGASESVTPCAPPLNGQQQALRTSLVPKRVLCCTCPLASLSPYNNMERHEREVFAACFGADL